jgi:hypothetical protein
MKVLSAAIVVLAGALTLAAGSFVDHADTATFVMIVGIVLSLCGLGGWAAMMLCSD